MTPDEFRLRLKEFEEKVLSFEQLQTEVLELRDAVGTRRTQNERNTKAIIEEFLHRKQAELRRQESQIEAELERLEEQKKYLASIKARDRVAAERMFAEKAQGFPWLARAFSDYIALRDQQIVDYLENKERPAYRGAEAVRTLRDERRRLNHKYRVVSYLLDYYHALFPWLVDFQGDDLDDLIRTGSQPEHGNDFDPARTFLTEAEYESLSAAEKYQLALDRYWRKKKRPWELGRDYERFIGYLHERDGYEVFYQGIIKGKEDMGRDLICRKDNVVRIVQCKYWSRNKVIHEKHITQLFGTVVEYWVKNHDGKVEQLALLPSMIGSSQIVPCFITSTSLSDTAREFAQALRVELREGFPLQRYPSIKCNISRTTGEKIYHLPFDQQYDRTVVEEERNECYVETVADAEERGFRRAKRWRQDRKGQIQDEE